MSIQGFCYSRINKNFRKIGNLSSYDNETDRIIPIEPVDLTTNQNYYLNWHKENNSIELFSVSDKELHDMFEPLIVIKETLSAYHWGRDNKVSAKLTGLTHYNNCDGIIDISEPINALPQLLCLNWHRIENRIEIFEIDAKGESIFQPLDIIDETLSAYHWGRNNKVSEKLTGLTHYLNEAGQIEKQEPIAVIKELIKLHWNRETCVIDSCKLEIEDEEIFQPPAIIDETLSAYHWGRNNKVSEKLIGLTHYINQSDQIESSERIIITNTLLCLNWNRESNIIKSFEVSAEEEEILVTPPKVYDYKTTCFQWQKKPYALRWIKQLDYETAWTVNPLAIYLDDNPIIYVTTTAFDKENPPLFRYKIMNPELELIMDYTEFKEQQHKYAFSIFYTQVPNNGRVILVAEDNTEEADTEEIEIDFRKEIPYRNNVKRTFTDYELGYLHKNSMQNTLTKVIM